MLKALGLLSLSYIHPFGFDWLKPELIFVESYLGIEKWQFAIVLFSIIMTLWKKQFFYLLLVVFAYQTTPLTESKIPKKHRHYHNPYYSSRQMERNTAPQTI
ncbi:MAG: hypothetical protein Q9M39_01410 [Sulfurovum sp.]|nr:hypothetical protein [Sulfurovum sp.]